VDADHRGSPHDTGRFTGGSAHHSTYRYRTLGGALVTVHPSEEGVFESRCSGCDVTASSTGGIDQARHDANRHAEHCRAVESHGGDIAEIVREVAADIRVELSHVATRAGAGIALAGALLIGTVQQTPATMPLFAIGAAGAVVLTISLLLFFSVLLPPPARRTRSALLRWGAYHSGEQLLADSVNRNLAVYRATTSIELSRLLQARYRRLALALWAGVGAVLTLALGVSWDVVFGGV
jgi:ABC-type Fe3+-siderophore transport system permease subunit